jgi:hypothetical protein
MFFDHFEALIGLIVLGFVVKVIWRALVQQDDRDRNKWGG